MRFLKIGILIHRIINVRTILRRTNAKSIESFRLHLEKVVSEKSQLL